MSNLPQTILEIVNHLSQKHPELAAPMAAVASQNQVNQTEDQRKLQLLLEWELRQFGAPSPGFIKQSNVMRNGLSDATWVETGTFLGDTTALMAATGNVVFSIEPEPNLYARAVQRFHELRNVTIINDLSEIAMPKILRSLHGNVNFWLDGHYSGGITHKGPQDTPLFDELKTISANLENLNKVVVMVDDVRCCDSRHVEYQNCYPSLDYLVDWARANHLSWHIEQDSFIAKT